jgi:hypothetical protein
MAKKSNDNLFAVKAINITKEIQVPGIFYMSLNPQSHEVQVRVLKQESNRSLTQLATSVVTPIDVINIVGKDTAERNAVLSCFKELKCASCQEKSAVIEMCQTEIGPLCVTCWEELDPPVEWKCLENLQNYAI